MFWCYTINCEFSLTFVMIKVKKNCCVDYYKLWNIMEVNRIMSWKIIYAKIWFDCTSYASWLCEEKEKLKKWNWEWIKDLKEDKNEKKRKLRNGMTLERAN